MRRMRRASASKSFPDAEAPVQRPLLVRSFFAGALAVAVTVGAPAFTFAADDADEDGAGQLSLNTAVLINESVGAGSTGDFAIRGSLFSEDLSARVHQQREAAAERLSVVATLDFERMETSAGDYQPVRAALFGGYSPHELPQTAGEKVEVSPAFYGAAAVVAVPLVLVAGVLLGRFWVRRKRVAL